MATTTKITPLQKTLAERVGRSNVFSLPRIDRVVVNVGVGKRVVASGKGSLDPLVKDVTRITGQKPVFRVARKAIASFKLREGLPVGIYVTLRKKRAEDFLQRLIRVALPRTRDFQGIPMSALDASGNLNTGIREQTIFPEAASDPTGIIFGMQMTVVTTARNRKEAEELFRLLGFPLRKE